MSLQKNRKNTILIVDDEPQVLKSLKREIEIYPLDNPLNVVTRETSAGALDYLKVNPDSVFLIIADLRMPPPNLLGSDLLLKVHQLYPEILLILLTAYSDLPEIQKAITADIQALIFKPWTSSLLLSEIVKALRLFNMRKENRELRERIQNQLEWAGEFQKNMLSFPEVETKHLSLDIKYEPVREYRCGGDYYDFLRLNSDRFLVLVGDVTGNGIKPAFVTAMIKALAGSIANTNPQISASEFLILLNQRLCGLMDYVNDILVAFSVLLIEPKKGMLFLSNAGHLPLYHIRNGECQTHKIEGPALSFRQDIIYQQKGIEIKKGDRFILFTDGLVELGEKMEFLEPDTVVSALTESAVSENPAEDIYNKFAGFHSKGRYQDDVTVSVITIL